MNYALNKINKDRALCPKDINGLIFCFQYNHEENIKYIVLSNIIELVLRVKIITKIIFTRQE